jgi:hypothetical protein
VVKDASSESGGRLPPAADRASPQTQDEAQSPGGNLTELAQLLAASIAQNQAARGRAGGVPTNAELTNLAKLVSAASGQRTLAPVFKDGLSSLSYAPTQPRSGQEFAPQSSIELGQDDEPMPIPSTWRQPAAHDEEGWMRQQMGAAFVGLLAGLAIVVPTVLWLSGVFDANKAKAPAPSRAAAVTADAGASSDIPAVRPVKVQVRPVEKVEAPQPAAAQYVTGSIDAKPAVPAPQPAPVTASASTASTARLVEPKAPAEDPLALATRRVESGDVMAAREILAGAEDSANGPVAFALAETFDPNMLAAWGSRGVVSDVAKARALYRKALGLGVARAQVRLDALK